jgi:hypothetical protein
MLKGENGNFHDSLTYSFLYRSIAVAIPVATAVVIPQLKHIIFASPYACLSVRSSHVIVIIANLRRLDLQVPDQQDSRTPTPFKNVRQVPWSRHPKALHFGRLVRPPANGSHPIMTYKAEYLRMIQVVIDFPISTLRGRRTPLAHS